MTVVYEAVRGDERIRGSIDDIAEAVGQKPKYIFKMMDGSRGARSGWKIRRLYRLQYEYYATNPQDEPVIGTLEEVASLLGYTQRYIRILTETGRRSKDGWSVRREQVAVKAKGGR